jgi:hypothetical protein
MISAGKYGFFLPFLLTMNLMIQPRFSGAQPIASKPNDASRVSGTQAFLRINEVNAKAARHFANHFISDGQEKWTIIDGFYIASFILGGVRTEAFYTSRGGFAYTVKYYQADLLKEDIRTAVLKKYQDHIIDVVTEISILSDQVYFIKIKNSSNIKMIRIAGKEMEVTEDFANAGG